MSGGKDDNEPVTERLCESRRETQKKEIDGIKHAVYIAFAVSMAWVTAFQLLLNHFA